MVNAQPTPTARIKGPMAAVPPDAIRQRERFIEAVALKLWLLNRSTMRIARSCQIRTGRKKLIKINDLQKPAKTMVLRPPTKKAMVIDAAM